MKGCLMSTFTLICATVPDLAMAIVLEMPPPLLSGMLVGTVGVALPVAPPPRRPAADLELDDFRRGGNSEITSCELAAIPFARVGVRRSGQRDALDRAVKIVAVTAVGVELEIAAAVGLQQRALVVSRRRSLLQFVRAQDVAVVDGEPARRQAAIEPDPGAVFDQEILVGLGRPVLHHCVVVAVTRLRAAAVLRSISLSHQPARSRR